MCWRRALRCLCCFFIWPHVRHLPAILSRAKRGPHLPDAWRLAAMVCSVVCAAPHRRFCRAVPTLHLLASLVLGMTVVLSVIAGLAFRRRFVGATLVFSGLCQPDHAGLLVGLGIGLMCQLLGLQPAWYISALGAQLSWTLPFGLFVMFAVLSRFNRFYEEAARDLGASAWQTFALSCCPSCCLTSLPWRCSALRCPTMNLRAPC